MAPAVPEPVDPAFIDPAFIDPGFIDPASIDTASIDTGFLTYLAESLGRAIADNGGGVLVHVVASADGPDVGILPLEGQAPADALLGAAAPEQWAALGVATRGRARPLDAPSRSARPVEAEVVVIVARDGRVVSRLRQGDRVFTETPASGLTLDCLQRALGLPTAPAEVPPSQLLAVIWLERVVRTCRRRGQPLRWTRMTGLHPAADLLMAMEKSDQSLDWGRLRQLVIEGAWPELSPTGEEAAWFDDGAFSR